MPDILIRGMEMPKSCRECFACFPGRDDNDEPTTYCTLTEPASPTDCWGVIDGINHQQERMWFCPLVELPAHGDLISRDEAVSVLKSIGSRDYRREKGTICDAIKMISHSQYVPTIIPASEEVTNDPKT